MLSFFDVPRRTLGLDWGERRIGVAVSDEMGFTSQGVGVVKRTGKDLEEVAGLVRLYDVERIVVGMPVHDDGTPSKSAPKIQEWVERLRPRVAPIPIELYDESNTSVEANRILKERGMTWQESKKHIDRVAAAVLLQAWLDERPRP